MLEIMKSISEATDRINRIIDNTRKMIRKDSEMEIKSFYPDKRISDILEIMDTKAKKRNISIKTCLHFNNKLKTNPIGFEQIITNLLKNSLEAFDDFETENKILKLETYKDGCNFILGLNDNGPGIDNKIIENVFDPFVSTKKDNNMGIGLTLVKNLISNLNGKISVKNIEPHGVQFIVSFPLINDKRTDENSIS